MRPSLVALKIQGIAGIVVDTSCSQDNVRVFVRVVQPIDSIICGASSLSNPLKRSPTEIGSSAIQQRHVAFWPDNDDSEGAVVFEAREGEKFQLQVCLHIQGKGNFPIGTGTWERSAKNAISDVFVGCVLADDKRRSIAYCIDSKGGAMLRVTATWEYRKAEFSSEIHETLYTGSKVKRQQHSQYASLDDDPCDVSIGRTLPSSFEQDPTHVLPATQDLEMRLHNNSKAKSRLVRFFQRSNNSISSHSTEKKMEDKNKTVASSSYGVRSDRKQLQGTAHPKKVPLWTSPKPAKPSKLQATKESFRKGSPVVRSRLIDCDDVGASPVSVGYKGTSMNWVDNSDNEMPIDDMNAILFPSGRKARQLSADRPLTGVFNPEKAPRPLMLHPGKGKGIPRQFSEDSESFSDVFERPLAKMQLHLNSPQTTTPYPTLERFGPSKIACSYRTESPTAVWESISSRTPSPVEISNLRMTEASIINPFPAMQHVPSQPSYRTETQCSSIPTHYMSELMQEMYPFERGTVETFSEVSKNRSASPALQKHDYDKAATVPRWPDSRVEQPENAHTYSRDTQPWQSEQIFPQNKRFTDSCLRIGQPTPMSGMLTCGVNPDKREFMHRFDKKRLHVKYSGGQDTMSTPVNETLSTVDSDSSETRGFTVSEPPPDFLFCQGDGSYFCKPDEDAVQRRRRLWREKMRYVAEFPPSTVGEEHNLDYPSYDFDPEAYASGPLKSARMDRDGACARSNSQKVRYDEKLAPETFRGRKPHGIRSSKGKDEKPGSPIPPALESWPPKGLLEGNAKTLGQRIVALVEPLAACALVRPPDRPSEVPSTVPSTINGEETSVGELTATSYERQIDRLRQQSTSNIQQTLRSSQQTALKNFGLTEDALNIRSRSVSTKNEDYFSDYKGLQ